MAHIQSPAFVTQCDVCQTTQGPKALTEAEADKAAIEAGFVKLPVSSGHPRYVCPKCVKDITSAASK